MSEIRITFPQFACASLILLLSLSASLTVARAEDGNFTPQQVQSWKDYLKNYPTALAQYQKEEQSGRKMAKAVTLSKDTDGEKLAKSYPVLQGDIKNVKDVQEKIVSYQSSHPDSSKKQSLDITTFFHVGEIRDEAAKTNILFFAKDGRLWCGAHGCMIDVYVDTGNGYHKAPPPFIVGDQIYLTKLDGHFLLFAGPPENLQVKEWILKDGKFVENNPPPTEPQTADFQEWKDSLEQQGKWPPQ
jgi:hypothetical protein